MSELVTERDVRQQLASPAGLQVMVRTVTPGDEAFVLSNWARTVREVTPLRGLPAEVFNAHMHRMAELVSRETTLIACAPDCPDQAFGFVVGRYVNAEPLLEETLSAETIREIARQCPGVPVNKALLEVPVLDMIYIRGTFRRAGLATTLLRHQFPFLGKRRLFTTHLSRSTPHFRERWQLTYHPYLARPL